jgi:hypothetical protein
MLFPEQVIAVVKIIGDGYVEGTTRGNFCIKIKEMGSIPSL